nr:3-deoxy-7-phosphoheptulonate synthase [uncultured Microbacterium sp.]
MLLKTDPLDHWRTLPIKQQPSWYAPEAAAEISAELATLPPLVFAGEVDILREKLGRAAAGQAFLLQGGDCAETFAGATAEQIRNRIKTVLQMAVVLTYGASMPVVKMGRMAGQFAKPRSSDTETRGDVTLPAYRGDIVNGYDFTEASRRADPARMLKAYHTAASTLNLIRAFTQGGFADLREVHSWNKGFAQNPANQRYERLATEIDRAIKFMEAAGADFDELRRRGLTFLRRLRTRGFDDTFELVQQGVDGLNRVKRGVEGTDPLIDIVLAQLEIAGAVRQSPGPEEVHGVVNDFVDLPPRRQTRLRPIAQNLCPLKRQQRRPLGGCKRDIVSHDLSTFLADGFSAAPSLSIVLSIRRRAERRS